MPAILEIQKDRHRSAKGQADARASEDAAIGTKRGYRRPTRGTELHNDTVATLEVVMGNGGQSYFQDAGGTDRLVGQRSAFSKVYSNFMLQSISEERMEKQQILETFGEPYIFFFGERPRIMSFQGVLLNTYDFNWEAEWWENYENLLRGTKCVENDARVYLTFDQTIVSGYVLSTSSQKNANDRNHVTFGFQLYVTSWATLTRLGDPRVHPEGNDSGAQVSDEAALLESFLANGPGVVDDLNQIGTRRALEGIVSASGEFSPAEQFLATSAEEAVKVLRTIDYYLTESARYVANIFSGDTVRMPAGYAGDLAWAEASREVTAEALKVSYSGPIKYTVFSDNADEYVNGQPPTIQQERGLRAVETLNEGLFSVEQRAAKVQVASLLAKGWKTPGFENTGFESDVGPFTASLIAGTIGLAGTIWSIADPASYGALGQGLETVGLVIEQGQPPTTLGGWAALAAPSQRDDMPWDRESHFGWANPTRADGI